MSESAPDIHSAPRGRRTAIKIFNTLAIVVGVAFIVHTLRNDRDAFVAALSIEPSSLLTAVALLVIYFLLYSYRFVILIEHHCKRRLGVIAWFKMLVVMRFMNNVVPQMGTVYRGVRLKRDFGVSYTDYISANVFFIWSDTIFNFVIAALALAVTGLHLDLWGFDAIRLLTGGVIALVLLPYLSRALLARAPSGEGALNRILRKLSTVADDLTTSITDIAYMLRVNGVALLSFITMALVFQTLLGTVGITLPAPTLAVFYALYRLTFHINITPGNIGIREAAFGLLCSQADVAVSTGVLVSAELRILSIVVLVALGLLFASGELRAAWRSLRAGTPEPAPPPPAV